MTDKVTFSRRDYDDLDSFELAPRHNYPQKQNKSIGLIHTRFLCFNGHNNIKNTSKKTLVMPWPHVSTRSDERQYVDEIHCNLISFRCKITCSWELILWFSLTGISLLAMPWFHIDSNIILKSSPGHCRGRRPNGPVHARLRAKQSYVHMIKCYAYATGTHPYSPNRCQIYIRSPLTLNQ